jgi:hypothetical protein
VIALLKALHLPIFGKRHAVAFAQKPSVGEEPLQVNPVIRLSGKLTRLLAGILLPARYRIGYFRDGYNEGPDHDEILNRQTVYRY